MAPSTSLKQTYTSKTVNLPNGGGRILCIADIRGDMEELNRLAKETNAVAVIHTGDFGYFEPASLDRIADKTLKHLITYSPTIPPPLRTQLLAPSLTRQQLQQQLLPSSSDSFPLSQFPRLLPSSKSPIKLACPVFAVYGACEDVRVIEKMRMGEYAIDNLTVLDEATTRCLEIGGVKLRLLGLGGALVMAKMFDNGEGQATIAGGGGTMWTTALQIGELVDTAQRVYDQSETRLLITHASIGREPILSLLSVALKADLTISAGLHFRYGTSWNEWGVQDEGGGGWWAKCARGKARFDGIWEMVKAQVEAVIDPEQRIFLDKALAVINRPTPSIPSGPGAVAPDEPTWKNTWSWNLTDSSFGHLVLDIKDGRVSSELKSQGFNYSHRSKAASATATSSAVNANTPAAASQIPPKPSASTPSQLPSNPNANSNPKSSHNAQSQSPAPNGLPSSSNAPSASTAKPSDSTTTAAPTSSSSSMTPSTSMHDRTGTDSPVSSPIESGRRQRSPHTLFVQNLPVPVSEEELKEFFGESASKITHIKLVFDNYGTIPRAQKRFAYVEFADGPAMEAGLTGHAEKLKDVVLKVVISNPPSDSEFGSIGRGGMRGGRGGRGRGDWGNGARGGMRGARGGWAGAPPANGGGERPASGGLTAPAAPAASE